MCHEVVAWLGTTDYRYPVDKIQDTERGTPANFDKPRQLNIVKCKQTYAKMQGKGRNGR